MRRYQEVCVLFLFTQHVCRLRYVPVLIQNKAGVVEISRLADIVTEFQELFSIRLPVDYEWCKQDTEAEELHTLSGAYRKNIPSSSTRNP